MALQAVALIIVAGLAGTLLLLRLFAADVYDIIIVWMTARWYATVFDKLSVGDRVLDVGVGTATALVRNKASILQKRLSIVGLDYEAAYIRKAEQVLEAADLHRPVPEGTEGYQAGAYYCRVFERSIYDDDIANLCEDDPSGKVDTKTPVPEERRFHAAYFSGSLTVMPDPVGALRAVAPLIKKEGGRVFITQTFEKKHSSLKAALKPLMKYVTTIDFGQLTTEADIERIISEAKIFDTIENGPIPGSVQTPWQTARLIVLRAKDSAAAGGS
jgi:ubiquinone/menaquinone biosynthesis C-methylase UbiE